MGKLWMEGNAVSNGIHPHHYHKVYSNTILNWNQKCCLCYVASVRSTVNTLSTEQNINDNINLSTSPESPI